MGDRDFDDILTAVATDINDYLAIEKLGKALGFTLGEISAFSKTNVQYGEVTSRGTLQMLRKWQQNVSKAEERSLLRQRLIEAGLRRVAEHHLPETAPTSQGPSQAPAQTTAQAATAPISIVTDRQIIELSKILPSDNYGDLAEALGISLTEAKEIKKKHLLDNKAATEDLLSAWKIRTGGRIDKLDQALKKANCAGLIELYKK
ncbi:uncharacterized protein [Diadema antillarum]|uniref:uncharacterized protein n=1 Tax=Diadema antillarum TaxID=105358 RepID=UPI003A8826A8